jgi:hypothetical protein
VDEHQSGFLSGRSILENFVFATELVQSCFKRKAPTLVLKLDFSKAFDSINWSSLRLILLARGFPALWCDWMEMILTTSKSAILLNGIPGAWIDCKQGLRQGDPLSPYLFLLVADVLQQMIRQDPSLCHPLLPGSPCPVLQYADDTLIIVRADAAGAVRLKEILEQFAAATGLTINFQKSTLVPMHVPELDLASIRDGLGYRVEGFPQTYLGLPLSSEKLKIAQFSPLIARVDKYLSGWAAVLLSAGGRVVLLNAVLDALPTFAMGALDLPPALLKAVDGLRRAFLWDIKDKVSGAKCLVTWDVVCRPKIEGGLGIKCLAVKNESLQMKQVHRLHADRDAPWPRWVWNAAAGCTPTGHHWSALEKLMPIYRSITTSVVGDGRRTAFWLDAWLDKRPLC